MGRGNTVREGEDILRGKKLQNRRWVSEKPRRHPQNSGTFAAIFGGRAVVSPTPYALPFWCIFLTAKAPILRA